MIKEATYEKNRQKDSKAPVNKSKISAKEDSSTLDLLSDNNELLSIPDKGLFSDQAQP